METTTTSHLPGTVVGTPSDTPFASSLFPIDGPASDRDWGTKEIIAVLEQLCGDVYIDCTRLKKLKEIGRGSFARVDLCILKQSDGKSRKVAVKKLLSGAIENQRDLDDFCMEANVLREVKHSCIVDFIGIGTDCGNLDEHATKTLYIVSEYMGGGTLKALLYKQVLKPGTKLYSTRHALEWCLQIARGLKYLHCAKPMIIHRDVKTENILLSEKSGVQTVKIGDFGLHARIARTKTDTLPSSRASAMSEAYSGPPLRSMTLEQLSFTPQRNGLPASPSGGGAAASYTLTGCTGSFVYMAPEVYKGLPYNEKVDVYSFAIIMYELLARTMTNYFTSVAQLESYVNNVCCHGFRPCLPPSIPPAAVVIIQECWNEDPNKRPSMRRVVSSLKELIDTLPQDAKIGSMNDTNKNGKHCSCCLM